MMSFFPTIHPIFSRASARGSTPLAQMMCAFPAAATGSAATGPAVGITTAIAVPIKMEGN